ncbi:hypothetical protein D3C78_1206790 [compost metagenome]
MLKSHPVINGEDQVSVKYRFLAHAFICGWKIRALDNLCFKDFFNGVFGITKLLFQKYDLTVQTNKTTDLKHFGKYMGLLCVDLFNGPLRLVYCYG